MKHPNLTSASAQKIYASYMKRVKKTSRPLSGEDKTDILNEINSHIYEGLQRQQSNDETAEILDILEKLGEPEDFLQPMVAERKLKEATRTFNPKHVFQALALNITQGIKYFVFAFLYLFLFSFVIMVFLKIAKPKNTGLFLKDGEFLVLGYTDEVQGVSEVLGWWFIPVCLIATTLFYLVITLMMKWTSK